ncbi:MAG: hypothetical protein F6K31_06200 [Symploca sp. SIO2G7]|nr:hypothetical protein [Symploca sp. SIO2G7]
MASAGGVNKQLATKKIQAVVIAVNQARSLIALFKIFCYSQLSVNWSLVIGHWSLVIGHWSLVISH